MRWTRARIRRSIWLNDGMSQQQDAPVHHEDHGSTPAAWTVVVLVTIAFIVGTLAIILANWPMFWVGVGILVLGAIAGKVLAMMGFGKKR
jgi:hypothetical protein